MESKTFVIGRLELVRFRVGVMPRVIADAGEKAGQRFVEFFTANIRNRNTRLAYARAAGQFFTWCDDCGLALSDLEPCILSVYIEELQRTHSAPSVKQHLSAIRMLFDWLVVGQVPVNPAAVVRGPRYLTRCGKTPVLSTDEARHLLDSIDTATLVGLRDRALIGVMLYTFARVSAVTATRLEDYFQQGKRWWLRLHEKGGKRHEVPAHYTAEAYLDAYLEASGLDPVRDKARPLFQTLNREKRLTGKTMHRIDVLRMVKRHARRSGLPSSTCCHSFRATGITTYLENGGMIEKAQAIAAHESPRTTKIYDRRSGEITLLDVERIRI
jgi:integrase/recombinase XerD